MKVQEENEKRDTWRSQDIEEKRDEHMKAHENIYI
jgi:hypothetical protein